MSYLSVGTKVEHVHHGFKGIVVSQRGEERSVAITEGYHPYNREAKYYHSMAKNLVAVPEPVRPSDEYEMEIEIAGMTISTDFVTFKKIVNFMESKVK